MNQNYIDILNFVIDSGRVLQSETGFDQESLRQEITFEARERGLSDVEIQECIDFAMNHCTTL